jgi:hypothetical protein
MALVEDHDVIQTLATDRTDHALDASVLPRGSWGRNDFRDPHRSDSLAKVLAIRGVTVAQQIARSGVPRKRFGLPGGRAKLRWMLGDGRVNDPSAVVGQNDHHVKQPNDTDATTNISIAPMPAA